MPDYFVPGYGISRRVIQIEIRYHCGPEATARPYVYQGRDGFLVTTKGPPLTYQLISRRQGGIPDSPRIQAQIDDLKESSQNYEQQRATASQSDSKVQSLNSPVEVDHRAR